MNKGIIQTKVSFCVFLTCDFFPVIFANVVEVKTVMLDRNRSNPSRRLKNCHVSDTALWSVLSELALRFCLHNGYQRMIPIG